MRIDNDNDSAFGGDEDFLWDIDAMFSPLQPLAGTKREVHHLGDDVLAKTQNQPLASVETGLSLGSKAYPSEHIDPRVLCCTHCPEPCLEPCNQRPSKRRASATKVGEYHNLAVDLNTITDCQFLEQCFDKFCRECMLESPCPADCATPCRGDSCPEDEACFDPHCSQSPPECADGCVDPECTKLACPDQPCFCQKCDVQPCPLGDPNNECHFSHTAPTPVGTIYCYDNAPCHFQEGYHGHHDDLTVESYPCFSQNHAFTGVNNITATGATAPTLSRSNFDSLDHGFINESPSELTQVNFSNCYLNISSEHCHVDGACCHGPNRACGDTSPAPKQQMDLWDTSMSPRNVLANDFMNFGFNAEQSTGSIPLKGAVTLDPFNHIDPVYSLDDHSWMLLDSSISPTFEISNARQHRPDFLNFDSHGSMPQSTTVVSLQSAPTIKAGVSNGESEDGTGCVCRWQHTPGNLCLATFDTPEALHKHIKAAHVDNCARCCCQWEGCEAASKDFKQRSKLSRHLLGHAGHRPYACSYEGCDKTFATNQAKDNHERTHTGERPYVCNRCGYTTTTQTQLQTHISALHEGKKPHKCRFCDFTCADSSNLSKHERTHQTLRPYRCPQASCTFKPDCRWENLKRHLRRSGHCPQLLVETSDEYKMYRENVRREIEQWHKRNEDGSTSKTGRRKARS